MNKLRTKLALFTRLYRDDWSTKHKKKIYDSLCLLGCYTTLIGKQFEGTIILQNIRYCTLHTMV
jgi:hypothetical protein